MANKEFYGFEVPSESEWLERIKKDLKGKDFDQILKINLEKGIDLNAIHFPEKGTSQSSIGAFPLTRGSKVNDNAYRIEQAFDIHDPRASNQLILEALKNGVSSLALSGVNDIEQLKQTLTDVHANFVCIGLKDNTSIDSAKILAKLNLASVFYGLDPFTNDSYALEDAINFATEHIKQGVYSFSLDGTFISNQGGSVVSELYYLAKAGNEILYRLTNNGVSVDEASATISFNLSFGSNYYLNIAKARSFRMLWANIVNQYKAAHDCSLNCWIHGVTNTWNKLNIDQDTNILRATTEGMSAVLGGVNSLEINHNNIGNRSIDEQYRITRNIHHLINEESYLNQVADPLGGSYLIEDLTNQLATQTWTLFRADSEDFETWSDIPGLEDRIKHEREDLINALENDHVTLIGGNKFRIDQGDLSVKSELNLKEA